MATASADETKLEWPELYGFWIYGNGPTYVIYVEPTSISETAGIRVGDRIIELDNTDVGKQSADFIKYMAKNSKNSPPAISVQSYSKEIELVPSMSSLQPTSSKSVSNFGFNIKGEMPVIVDYVLENSPAWSAGLRANDIIVEVNNKQLKYAESLRPLLNMNTKLKLKYIPTSRNESEKGLSKSANNSLSATAAAVVAATSAGQAELHARKSLIPNDITEGKLKRAQNFYATLNQVFPNEPDKRKFILNELRKFTELGDMYRLASSLNSVLVTPPQRTLLNEIKPFIPTKQQALFENLTSLHNSSTVFGPKTSLAQPAVNDQQQVDNNYTTIINKITPYIQEQTRKQSAYEPNKIGPLGKRRVILKKNLNENYGFALKGSKPVIVDSVNQTSIASAAGLMPNDVILSINGVNVEDKTHRQLVELLSLAETSSVLEVIQKSEFESYKSIRDASASQNRESASASNRDSSLDLLNYEGKSFKEKVKEVLSPTEKHVLKKILLDYNNNKDVDSFLNATTKMLDTKTKKSLWFYLLPILEEEHQGRVEKFINLNKDAFTNSSPFYTTVNARLESKDVDERPAKSGKKTADYGVDDDDDPDSDHVEETRSNYNPRDIDRETYGLSKYPTAHKMSKQYSSAPSLISLNNNNRSYEDSDLVMKFLKQLEYLLNYKERSHVKQALKAYNGDKNIGLFVDTLDKILDTPAKRTLWFHIMPLLDEDDQEYAKRKLCLLSSRDNQSQYDQQPASSSSMSDKQQQRSMSTKKEDDDEDEFYFYSHDNDQRSVDGAYELNEHKVFPRLRTRSKSRSGLIDPDDDIYQSSNDKFQSQKLTSSSYKWQDSDEDLTNVKINRIRSKENLKKQPTHDYVIAPNMTTSRSVVKYLDSANDGSYRYSSTKITTLNEEKHQYEYEAVLDNSDLSDYWPNKPPPAPMSITSEVGKKKRSRNTHHKKPHAQKPPEDKTTANLEVEATNGEHKSTNDPWPDGSSGKELPIKIININNVNSFKQTDTNSKPTNNSNNNNNNNLNNKTNLTNKNRKIFNISHNNIIDIDGFVDENNHVKLLPPLIQSKSNKNFFLLKPKQTNKHANIDHDDDEPIHISLSNNVHNKPDHSTYTPNNTTDTNNTSDIYHNNTSNNDVQSRENPKNEPTTKQETIVASNAPPAPPLPSYFTKNNSEPTNQPPVKSKNSHLNGKNSNKNDPKSPKKDLNNQSINNSDLTKRINWEKIENKSLDGTIWEKFKSTDRLSGILDNLDIESLFSQKSTSSHSKFNSTSLNEISILSPKKAYNIAIVLGSLKYTFEQIVRALYVCDKSILKPELIKHLIQYSPDDSEIEKFKSVEESCFLKLPDRFMLEISSIPNYKLRLKSLQFVFEFEDKLAELTRNLALLEKAIGQVKESIKFKNIIELILVIGNHLNAGNARLSEANAFRLNVLPQLDQTKLSTNNKFSLMNVLARLCEIQFPESIKLREDFSSVDEASKISTKSLCLEIDELKSSFENIYEETRKIESDPNIEDKFKDYIDEFCTKWSGELNNTKNKSIRVDESFISLVKYFGEDSSLINSQQFFTILNEFTTKFERAHNINQNLNGKFMNLLKEESSKYLNNNTPTPTPNNNNNNNKRGSNDN